MLEAVFQNTALVKSIIDIHPVLYTEIYTEFRKKVIHLFFHIFLTVFRQIL